ncbi:MAG: hypothetical protein NTV23_07970 [Propionibacteriales bacterium]|nr:hypothetical protein [Propionibacteriales bacterium]
MRRILLLLAVVALTLGTSAVASADDSFTPGPTAQPGDPFGGQTLPPGPVFVVTPSSSGSTLPQPSTPDEVQEQIERDRAQNSTATPTVTTAPTPAASGSASDGPSTAAQDRSGFSGDRSANGQDDGSGALWWALGAGGLAVLVLLAVLVVAVRRRDRTGAESLKNHAS